MKFFVSVNITTMSFNAAILSFLREKPTDPAQLAPLVTKVCGVYNVADEAEALEMLKNTLTQQLTELHGEKFLGIFPNTTHVAGQAPDTLSLVQADNVFFIWHMLTYPYGGWTSTYDAHAPVELGYFTFAPASDIYPDLHERVEKAEASVETLTNEKEQLIEFTLAQSVDCDALFTQNKDLMEQLRVSEILGLDARLLAAYNENCCDDYRETILGLEEKLNAHAAEIASLKLGILSRDRDISSLQDELWQQKNRQSAMIRTAPVSIKPQADRMNDATMCLADCLEEFMEKLNQKRK